MTIPKEKKKKPLEQTNTLIEKLID